MAYKDLNIDERMFDFKEYYKRIARQLPNDCIIVEVGVADAASSLFIADQLYSLGKTFKLYMVDSMNYGQYSQMKVIYENIIKSGLGRYIEVLPYDSLIAAKMFNGSSLHFVFLDSSHTHPETAQEIAAWYGKLIDGGILAGHDYTSEENPGVKQSVDEMLPSMIQREPITTKGGEQEFEPHQFLFTYPTERSNGIWAVTKNFYFTPKIKTK